MDQTRWARIEEVYGAVLDSTGSDRARVLDEACSGDPDLRAEVSKLLAQLDADPSFLERPLIDLTPFAPPNESPAPATIGPYRLVRLLGRGGMGEVHLAVREVEDLQQTVALKIIRRGMDTDDLLDRFRLERRILANLHHANIAGLMDAAVTDDGRPYFVMEYVEGTSLTAYCDEHQLSIRDRLALFKVVCGAVQHAHQNLVVHRDLKPGNILVGKDGVPKLLDFGIGKVIAPSESLGSGAATATDARLLTPAHAAPEQITGDAVTTATDVYALGIILYELLSGRHPYLTGSESRKEIEEHVLRSAPPRPSEAIALRPADDATESVTTADVSRRRSTDPAKLRRALRGDLDNIVHMALRKEPERRYATAAAFADDVQRHLAGMPVRARADTLGYRARKFIGRHTGAVVAAATAILALGATTTVTLVQSRRVAREAERVTRERDKALEVRGFLMEMFGATGADQSVGDTVTVRRLLDVQAAQLDRAFADRPEVKADMMEVLADGYDRLGLYRNAEPLAREALALRRRLLGETHPDVAAAYNLHGWVLHELGRSKDAEPLLKQAITTRRLAGEPARADLARSLNDLGVVYNALSRFAEAEAVLTEALTIRRRVHGDAHRAVGITANNLAAAFYYQKRYDSATVAQTLSLQALNASVGPDHQRTLVALSNLAAFKHAAGNHPSAEKDYRELLARQARLQGRDHPATGRMMVALAIVLSDRGRTPATEAMLSEADTLFREAIAAFEAKLGPSHPQVGVTLDRLSRVLVARGRRQEAVAVQNRAVDILQRALGDSNPSTLSARRRLAGMR